MSIGPDLPAGSVPGSRRNPLGVEQLNALADEILREAVGQVWVTGEIVRFVSHASGHWYFSLTNAGSTVSCAMFRPRNAKVKFRPADGQLVLALAQPSVYTAQGRFQLILESLEPAGEGAAARALELLRARLAAEGLFDPARKKELPRFPRRLGVVTSTDGAALRDVLQVLRRRFAGVSVLISPASVQGQKAAEEIVAALAALDRQGLDVILLVRGGGSREDLAAFDDERVVRAVAGAVTPLVTGIGHEIDHTLADLAADFRAPTPSAAAEIVVREREALGQQVEACARRLAGAARHLLQRCGRQILEHNARAGMRGFPVRVSRHRMHFAELARRLETALRDRVRRLRELAHGAARRLSPEFQLARLAQARRRLEGQKGRLAAAIGTSLARHRSKWSTLAGRVEALSPLAVLQRGYALVTREVPGGALVRRGTDLGPGDRLHIRLAEGAAEAVVTAGLPPPDPQKPDRR